MAMSRAPSVRLIVWRLLCRGVPAFLLLWAGIAKAMDRQEAILAVGSYDVMPRNMVEAVATLLPWAEIGVGVLLVLGLFTRFAGIATAALAALFIAGMGQAKARGLAIDCGCFGGGGPGQGVSWLDIARDVPVLLAGLYLAARPRGPLQLDNYFESEGDHGERVGSEAGHETAAATAGEG